MEDGFALNAKTTTLMEERNVTDAKRKSLMKIKKANRIIYSRQKGKFQLIVKLIQIIRIILQVILV